MKHDADISTQDPSGMKDWFPCPECRRETTHSVLSIVNSRRFEEDGLVQFLENYLTVRCDGCGTISFSHVSRCDAEVDYNEDGTPFLPKRKQHYPDIQADSANIQDAFVSEARVEEIESLQKEQFDTTKLGQLLVELNRAYSEHSYFTCLMLIRAIVDHVPPIFKKTKFSEIVNNYADGGKSFRESMKHLDASCRKFADGSLHCQIRSKESVPTRHQVEFKADIDALLGEIIRVLKQIP
ncbi:hypothetical protein [Saccharospirillum salsuginis]|uniref:DUF4145 domain-containing protein n=1 Tax=Saccharospirillum salsuginis TaxID=418750 RepID=A0A918KPB8_9GAMM|nr:hypothetical protein [Saccharospirillum salsuginis]GGX71466.1 hypothetical protein GCM10007392_43740 [Saccharospirillum salsuginis]